MEHNLSTPSFVWRGSECVVSQEVQREEEEESPWNKRRLSFMNSSAFADVTVDALTRSLAAIFCVVSCQALLTLKRIPARFFHWISQHAPNWSFLSEKLESLQRKNAIHGSLCRCIWQIGKVARSDCLKWYCGVLTAFYDWSPCYYFRHILSAASRYEAKSCKLRTVRRHLEVQVTIG